MEFSHPFSTKKFSSLKSAEDNYPQLSCHSIQLLADKIWQTSMHVYDLDRMN